MSISSVLGQVAPSEEEYARRVIEADLARQTNLADIVQFMASLSLARHEPGLTVDYDDQVLTINREETRVEFEISAHARLESGSTPLYVLVLDERWEKTMKRPAAVLPPLRTASADAVIERIARTYLRFRNNIQHFEHDLALAVNASAAG